MLYSVADDGTLRSWDVRGGYGWATGPQLAAQGGGGAAPASAPPPPPPPVPPPAGGGAGAGAGAGAPQPPSAAAAFAAMYAPPPPPTPSQATEASARSGIALHPRGGRAGAARAAAAAADAAAAAARAPDRALSAPAFRAAQARFATPSKVHFFPKRRAARRPAGRRALRTARTRAH